MRRIATGLCGGMRLALVTGMSLAKYTHARLVVQKPTSRVYDAVRAMGDNHIGAVIVQKGREVVGIVTDRDLALQVLSYDLDPYEVTLREVMSAPVSVLPVTASEADAARMMLLGHVRRIVILDRSALVGLVTLDDLILEQAIDPASLAAIVRAQLSEAARLKRAGLTRPESSHDAGAPGSRFASRHEARMQLAEQRLVRRTMAATPLETAQQAEAALEEVLSGLMRRIRPEEAEHVLAELPSLMRERLANLPKGPDRSVSRDSLRAGLSSRLHVDAESASNILDQVGKVLEQSLSAGEVADLRGQLPPELKGLFTPSWPSDHLSLELPWHSTRPTVLTPTPRIRAAKAPSRPSPRRSRRAPGKRRACNRSPTMASTPIADTGASRTRWP